MVKQNGEPQIRDMVKVRFQRLGQVDDAGSTQAIQHKVEDFLDGTNTLFSCKRVVYEKQLSLPQRGSIWTRRTLQHTDLIEEMVGGRDPTLDAEVVVVVVVEVKVLIKAVVGVHDVEVDVDHDLPVSGNLVIVFV